jgi:hypothetical protein
MATEITTTHGTFSTEICPRCEPTVGAILRRLGTRCATHVKIRRADPDERCGCGGPLHAKSIRLTGGPWMCSPEGVV